MEKKLLRNNEVIKCCPICTRPCAEIIKITNDDSLWHRCSCGIIFQHEPPKHGVYNDSYKKEYEHMKEKEYRSIYGAQVYSPIIEDLTMGRKILEVGCNTIDNKKYFNDRGWIYWGLDVNDSTMPSHRIIKGDFENYSFGKIKFDVIWMSHVFEHFMDPINVINKSYNLLEEGGLLYIATPDTDWINNLSIPGWGHWNKKEHYIFWNIRSLKKQLEGNGFEVVINRRNHSMRYTSWHDMHILAQKIYY